MSTRPQTYKKLGALAPALQKEEIVQRVRRFPCWTFTVVHSRNMASEVVLQFLQWLKKPRPQRVVMQS